MADSIVTMRDVSVNFEETEVHSDISFDIRRGESITFMGPSGTGKTVLLKLIVGLLTPSSGSVHVFGEDVNEMSNGQLSELRKNVGMLFQGAALFDSLSVFENVAYPLRARGMNDPSEIEERVQSKLSLVGLAHKSSVAPAELSGGQRKRVGLARALASEPQLMLFDEPTTGLDPTSIRRIDELILQLNETHGITTISVTHDIQSAERISRRWILFADGRIQADGQAQHLMTEEPIIAQFITGNWEGEL